LTAKLAGWHSQPISFSFRIILGFSGIASTSKNFVRTWGNSASTVFSFFENNTLITMQYLVTQELRLLNIRRAGFGQGFNHRVEDQQAAMRSDRPSIGRLGRTSVNDWKIFAL
jgi:hypothetical protein